MHIKGKKRCFYQPLIYTNCINELFILSDYNINQHLNTRVPRPYPAQQELFAAQPT